MKRRDSMAVTGLFALLSATLALAFIVTVPAVAATGSAVWLEQGGGGRWLAMGGAACAASRDVYSGYWNPAALSLLGPVKWQAASMFEVQTLGRATMSLSGAMQTNAKGGYAVTLIRHSVSGLEEVDDQGNLLGEVDAAGHALLVSGGWAPVYRVRFGLTVKALQESLYDFSAMGGGADVGLMYQPTLTEDLWLALTVHNAASALIWDGSSTDALARAYTGGVAWRAMQQRLLLSADAVMREGANGVQFHAGAEAWVVEEAAVQVGINQMHPCIGGTYSIRLFEIDYAFTYDREDLATHHQVNVIFRW